MFRLTRRKVTASEAELLVKEISLSPEITGYSVKEWMRFENVLIAEDNTGQMVGVCLSYDFSSNWAFISVLYVLEEFRGKGIGKKLFHQTCQDILSRGRNIYTSSRNPIVIKMMSELNFLLFETLYTLPKPYKKYEFDFLMRTVKWIASLYRVKEFGRKSIQHRKRKKFVYGVKVYGE